MLEYRKVLESTVSTARRGHGHRGFSRCRAMNAGMPSSCPSSSPYPERYSGTRLEGSHHPLSSTIDNIGDIIYPLGSTASQITRERDNMQDAAVGPKSLRVLPLCRTPIRDPGIPARAVRDLCHLSG